MKCCTYNLLNCPRCVQRRCVVGLAPGEESCDCRWQIGKWARLPKLLCPHEIRLDENVDCGSQGENVEDVNVVVSHFRPHMGEVQELKREICNVGREKSGGNEVLQEVNALLSVERLSVAERKLRWSATLVDCPRLPVRVHVQDTTWSSKRTSSSCPRLPGNIRTKQTKCPHRGRRAQLET